jgi:hypothetical protein
MVPRGEVFQVAVAVPAATSASMQNHEPWLGGGPLCVKVRHTRVMSWNRLMGLEGLPVRPPHGCEDVTLHLRSLTTLWGQAGKVLEENAAALDAAGRRLSHKA